MGGDSTWHTRESMAHEYQLAKYYAGNGENWGANGRWEASREEEGPRDWVASRNLPKKNDTGENGNRKTRVETPNPGHTPLARMSQI
jgi:hypothetical protein